MISSNLYFILNVSEEFPLERAACWSDALTEILRSKNPVKWHH